MKKYYLPILYIVVGIIFGGGVAFFLLKQDVINLNEIRYKHTDYKYINPLLAIDIPETKIQKYIDMKNKLSAYINDQTNQQKIEKISIYFRDINNGNWIGINENVDFEPASLLKVPTMIAYYKLAESQPNILLKQIIYKDYSITGAAHDKLNISPELKIGNAYTIDELIKAMIVYSDNNAKDLLIDNIDPKYLKQIFVDLGIESPEDVNKTYTISAKTYSLFFRILYNTSYINEILSDKALGLLINADFKEGLNGGLPDEVPLAHKFGETPIFNNGQPVALQLHDCGIVYATSNPYFICVMTQGKNIQDIELTIQNISKITYDSFSK